MRHETTDEGHGRMAESQNPDVHLETVEDTATKSMGTAKTGYETILGIRECEQPERNHGNRLQRYYDQYSHNNRS
jgi:hypothetical protein